MNNSLANVCASASKAQTHRTFQTLKRSRCAHTGKVRAVWAFSLAAMAASDSSPAWAGCHGYTDPTTPVGASSELQQGIATVSAPRGETNAGMNRIAASREPGSLGNLQGYEVREDSSGYSPFGEAFTRSKEQ